MAEPTFPVAGMTPAHRQHVQKITQARSDPWGDPHGGGLASAVTDAHKAGVPHPVIAHYSGLPIERVARMASFAKNDGDPFGIAKKLVDPQGNMFVRPTRKNTRRQNVGAVAAASGGLYGTVGAVGGAAHGHARAKGGMKALHSVGAAPSRARAAGIVAGHSARTAGKVGLAAGAAGAAYGAALGAVVPHRKDNKKLPIGRVQKSDRHMSAAPRRAASLGAVPKHSEEAAKIRAAAGTPRKLPVGAAVRAGFRATTIGKSAFGVDHPELVAKKKIGVVLPGAKLPADRGRGPFKPLKARRGATPGQGVQGQRREERQNRV